LFILEDAAHAHGSQLRGVKSGNLADAAAFSFFPTKVMTTCEGAMITTNNDIEDYLARSFRNQGKRGMNYGSLHHDLGNNWRITEMAVGAGFDRYVQELHVGARLKVSHSAMVVAWPALSRLNFARMSIKPKFHFNQMLQRGIGKQGPIRFSMLANSSFWDRDARVAEKVADIDAILEAAERYIGREPLHTSKLYTYECAKTEFLSEEEEKRRYSDWIEHARDTNYIAVLPGKFSFFPTVAYQTYLRIKELLQLDATVYHPTYGVDPAAEQQAKALVADPYPIQILSSELDGEVDLLKWVCEEDSVVSATRS
jgi:DegT/DnrJ/EryC1/StrS aminotransferase family